MKRCAACGNFFDAEKCPNDHSHIEGYEPPRPAPYPELRGRVVQYGGDICVIVSPADEDGQVGLAILHERVRTNLEDVEEIH